MFNSPYYTALHEKTLSSAYFRRHVLESHAAGMLITRRLLRLIYRQSRADAAITLLNHNRIQ